MSSGIFHWAYGNTKGLRIKTPADLGGGEGGGDAGGVGGGDGAPDGAFGNGEGGGGDGGVEGGGEEGGLRGNEPAGTPQHYGVPRSAQGNGYIKQLVNGRMSAAALGNAH